jgi:hypothetical protein
MDAERRKIADGAVYIRDQVIEQVGRDRRWALSSLALFMVYSAIHASTAEGTAS